MKKIYIFLMMVCVRSSLFASTGESMPWDKTLTKVLDSLQGPTAKIIGIASILVLGGSFLLSDGGMQKGKIFWVAIGLSVMFNASWIVSSIFGAGALL